MFEIMRPLLSAIFLLGASLLSGPAFGADLKPNTLRAWDTYVSAVEARIRKELDAREPFLVTDSLPPAQRDKARQELAGGRVFMVKLPAPGLSGRAPDIPSGIVHHWLGAVRVPGVHLNQVLDFVQKYDDHARYFDDVVASKLISREGEKFEIFLKLRRKKIVTVTYNTNHTVTYRPQDSRHESSRSVTTHIAELQNAGEPSEREKPVGHDSGYLWRLNSYWRFAEDADGVTVECESLTLSRDIPFGLGWLIRPMVEDISRESLERTLVSVRRGVKGSS